MGKRVLCCGTFDYLHPGHISFLEQAGALGTELYVVVARGENVKRIKGAYPDHSEGQRKARIAELDLAKEVQLGYPGNDFLKIVQEINPDIIALGYDQKVPPGLRETFPNCEIVVLRSHYPQKYKSSIYRHVGSKN